MRKKIIIIFTGLFLFSAFFCYFVENILASGAVVYLKNNIHYQQGRKDAKASYANWTNPGGGHRILPVNTPVTIGRFKRGFSIVSTDNKSNIYFEFDERNMNMTKEAYLELITSSSKVSLDGLSNIDQKGIKDGKAYAGMTKNGVRMALGYPAAHMTPSLDESTWIYWTNRFRRVAIEFDNRGIAISVP